MVLEEAEGERSQSPVSRTDAEAKRGLSPGAPSTRGLKVQELRNKFK